MTATRGPGWQPRVSSTLGFACLVPARLAPVWLALGCLALALSSAVAEPLSQSITISNGTVPPAQRLLKTTQQSPVRIEWTADRPTTVHLEGYDITVIVRPGKPATMQFKAHAAGRFAVHAHDGERQGPSSGHAHGRGALLRLEVHPR